jgi:hypothetical protein
MTQAAAFLPSLGATRPKDTPMPASHLSGARNQDVPDAQENFIIARYGVIPLIHSMRLCVTYDLLWLRLTRLQASEPRRVGLNRRSKVNR